MCDTAFADKMSGFPPVLVVNRGVLVKARAGIDN